MIKGFFNFLLSFLLLTIDSPIHSSGISEEVIENYTLKISRKFAKTYCNSSNFGISRDGALRFSVGETNKEFLNNKLNKYVDYQLLYKEIPLIIEKNCKLFDFPIKELENLSFK